MASERLLTSWSEYETAVGQLLPTAENAIAIFDRDLASLRLEKPGHHQALADFLRRAPNVRLRIAVQSAQAIRTHSPRLMQLLQTFAHRFQLVEVPPHLARLSDSMLLIDDASAVVRFHHDHPRSKEILADEDACSPYGKRFEDIWAEGGTPISATTLGL